MHALNSVFKREAWLVLALLCSASMYWYWRRLPHDSALIPATGVIRAKPLTDLFQPWYASRELLLRHRDPYGMGVTREIQVAFYGKALQGNGANASDGQRFAFAYRFAYPLYVVFLLAPTIRMQFGTAQAVLWWALAATMLLSVLLWLAVVRIRMSVTGLVGLCALFLTSLPVMQGLNLRQLGLLVAGLIAAAASSAVAGHLFLAGVWLALATIKPQLALLPIAWFALWVSADWRQRRTLAVGFAVGMAALLLASELLLPGWLVRFAGALRDYANYTGGASLIDMLLPSGLRWLVSALGVGATGAFCWRARRSFADSDSFALGLALVLNLSFLVMPTLVAPFNQVLLLPAAMLVVGHWSQLWEAGVAVRVGSVAFSSVALLPWVLSLIVALVSIGARDVPAVSLAPAYACLGLPFASFGLLVLLAKIIGRGAASHPAATRYK